MRYNTLHRRRVYQRSGRLGQNGSDDAGDCRKNKRVTAEYGDYITGEKIITDHELEKVGAKLRGLPSWMKKPLK